MAENVEYRGRRRLRHRHPTIWQRRPRVVRCTFRCARCCLWRITSVLCSPPDMRISKAAADETSIRWRRSRPEMLPRLWPQLSVETQRQLAQWVGQLVQRLRPRPVRSEEGHRAEDDVVDG